MSQEPDQQPAGENETPKPEREPKQEPESRNVPMACATCGRTPGDEAVARLTWTLGVERGRQVWTCDLCSRRHLRSIEGKLDPQWW